MREKLNKISQSLVAIVPCGIGGNDCTLCHFFTLLSNIVNFMAEKIAFPLAIVIIMWGGFLLLTAGGDTGKIEKGKRALTNGLWGLLIIIIAWLLVDTILKAFVDQNFYNNFSGFGPWNSFPSCSAWSGGGGEFGGSGASGNY